MPHDQKMRTLLPAAIITAALAITATISPTVAQAEGLSQALPSQPLADALETFARSVGVQIVYGPEPTKGLTSPGAPAGKPNRETLTDLLRGTGLTFEFVNETTVTSLPADSDSSKKPGVTES